MKMEMPLPQFWPVAVKAGAGECIKMMGEDFSPIDARLCFGQGGAPTCTLQNLQGDRIHVEGTLDYTPLTREDARSILERAMTRPGWWKNADWAIEWHTVRGHPVALFDDLDGRLKSRLALPLRYGQQSTALVLMDKDWLRAERTDSVVVPVTQRVPVQLELEFA